MYNFIKYHIFKHPLELKKTHDYKKGKPILTVVFLHGIASDSQIFKHTLKFLENSKSLKNIRFITYDWLGNGKSYSGKELKYNYHEQTKALENSLNKANVNTPVVFVAHSLGTLIATRYIKDHKKSVKELILLSPAIFKKDEIEYLLEHPEANLFMQKIPKKWLENRAFMCLMQNIAMNTKNYEMFEKIQVKTTAIYDPADYFISAKNIKSLKKCNKNISTIETTGKHHVEHSKYVKILEILEKNISETL